MLATVVVVFLYLVRSLSQVQVMDNKGTLQQAELHPLLGPDNLHNSMSDESITFELKNRKVSRLWVVLLCFKFHKLN